MEGNDSYKVSPVVTPRLARSWKRLEDENEVKKGKELEYGKYVSE